MRNRTTQRFRKSFAALPGYAQNRARQAYRTFLRHPNHPSLQFKQVHPSRPIFSVRVGLGHRALAVRHGEVWVWFWIGSHAEYDHLIRSL